jgi:hypothetical protein
MTAGRRSKLPFHSERAVSYPGSPGTITAPATVERRASMPPLVLWLMARLHIASDGRDRAMSVRADHDMV